MNTEEQLKESIERLLDVVIENCPRAQNGDFDSQDKPSFADALTLLSKHGKVAIIRDTFGRVQARKL